tara:strand:+ start:359 stop:559 length:201 start_codon:yes stop_codon:yes gene_type:complete
MLYRFTGTYTHGRTSITLGGVTFEGREPSECDCPRIANHPEFEAVEPVEEIDAPAKPKRGRPRKAN